MSSEELYSNLADAIPLVLSLLGLTFAVSVDSYIRKRHKTMMIIIISIVVILVLQNIAEFALAEHFIRPRQRTIVSIIGYSIRPLIIVLFYYIVGETKRYWGAWVLLGLNTAICLTAFFSDICFTIDDENIFQRGPLGYTCHIVSAMLLVYLVYLTMNEYGRSPKAYMWIPIFNALMIVFSVLLDSKVQWMMQPLSFLTVAVVNSTVFYYIWMHLQFVREHENSLMAEQRIKIMMSQIQPHFMYNTLSTIQSLCRTNPDQAARITEKFGAYLRQNLDSLEKPNLIPLEDELSHTKIYADIEMTRFRNVQVEYDIQDDEFFLPALTIQPMVENAIRHGVRVREHGLVKVTTKRDGENHVIIVEDNGKGFDVNENNTDTERSHIGIDNVRERVESMCEGTVNIESTIDVGTTVIVRIPARGQILR